MIHLHVFIIITPFHKRIFLLNKYNKMYKSPHFNMRVVYAYNVVHGALICVNLFGNADATTWVTWHAYVLYPKVPLRECYICTNVRPTTTCCTLARSFLFFWEREINKCILHVGVFFFSSFCSVVWFFFSLP